jgi:hypothetical protein
VIEIKPHRLGWKVFEAPGVEPVFAMRQDAMDYAQARARFRTGEFGFWIQMVSLTCVDALTITLLSSSVTAANTCHL